jgi:hypothetical protein
LSAVKPLASISVGVVVERVKSSNPWVDFLWRPLSVLTGVPDAAPWTELSGDGERTSFYAGVAPIELHRTETTYYQQNLQSETPSLWVGLRPTGSEPPFALLMVTADPAEAESLGESASDLIDQVRMPEAVRQFIAAFVAEHHVERAFSKRVRDRANPEALGRRKAQDEGAA